MTIISKKYKLIHFHNPKCGGTSFEVALSRYLGDDDVISIEHEYYRKKMGYITARNHLRDGYKIYIRHDFFKRILINIRSIFIDTVRLDIFSESYVPNFYSIFFHKNILVGRHNSAKQIKNLFPKEFKKYKKICVVRNPIDQFVSFYRYRKGKPLKNDSPSIKKDYLRSIPFSEFVNLCADKFFKDVCRIGGLSDRELNIDYIKYEQFEDEFERVIDECKIPKSFLTTYKNTRLRTSNNTFPKPLVTESDKKQILQCSLFLSSIYPNLYKHMNRITTKTC